MELGKLRSCSLKHFLRTIGVFIIEMCCNIGLLLKLYWYDFIIDVRILSVSRPNRKTTENKPCCCVYVAACFQPACPLLGFSNYGDLAGSGWDYWCPSLQAPWGTSEVMMRTETNTHMQLGTQRHTHTHTSKSKHADLPTLSATFHDRFFSTQCEDRTYLVIWLLHLVVMCCHCNLNGYCTVSTVSKLISSLSATPWN